jgi:hypothetical protein
VTNNLQCLPAGGDLPAPVVDDEPDDITPVKRKKTKKPAVNAGLVLPPPDPQFAHLTVPPLPDDGIGATPGGKKVNYDQSGHLNA